MLFDIGVWHKLHAAVSILFGWVVTSTAIGVSRVQINLSGLGMGLYGSFDLLIVTGVAYVLVGRCSDLLKAEQERLCSTKEFEDLLDVEKKLQNDGICTAEGAD